MQETNQPHHPIQPARTYIQTYVALVILTFLNVGIFLADIGPVTSKISLGIIVTMAIIDMAFFMGFKWDKKLHVLFFVTGFVFLGIFVALTMSDVLYRDSIVPKEQLPFGVHSPVRPLRQPVH